MSKKSRNLALNPRVFGRILGVVLVCGTGFNGMAQDVPIPMKLSDGQTEVPAGDYLMLPLRVHLVRDFAMSRTGTGSNGISKTTQMPMDISTADVMAAMRQVNEIWSQAGIRWELDRYARGGGGIFEESVTEIQTPALILGAAQSIVARERNDDTTFPKAFASVVRGELAWPLPSSGRRMNDARPWRDFQIERDQWTGHENIVMDLNDRSKWGDFNDRPKRMFHLYLFPYAGVTLQGTANVPGNYAMVGTWSDKSPNSEGFPKRRPVFMSGTTQGGYSLEEEGSLAQTIAHELGHNLSLPHPDLTNEAKNLMKGLYKLKLRSDQVTQARNAVIVGTEYSRLGNIVPIRQGAHTITLPVIRRFDSAISMSGVTAFFKSDRVLVFNNSRNKTTSGVGEIQFNFKGWPMVDSQFYENGTAPHPDDQWVRTDAAVVWSDSVGYFFKNDEFVEFNPQTRKVQGGKWDFGASPNQPGPQKLNIGWPSWPEKFFPIDAAILHPNGNSAFFFKGDEFFSCNVNTRQCSVPKKVVDEFSGWPAHFFPIDAAVMRDGSTGCFFRHDRFIRYDFTNAKTLDNGISSSINDGWEGLYQMAVNSP